MKFETINQEAVKRDFNSALDDLKTLVVRGGWEASMALGTISRIADGQESPEKVALDYPGWQAEDFVKLNKEIQKYTNERWEEDERERLAKEKGETVKRSFDRVLRLFKGAMKSKESLWQDDETFNQINDLAEGKADIDKIKKYYPGWTQDDFKQLSQELTSYRAELEREEIKEELAQKRQEIAELEKKLAELG